MSYRRLLWVVAIVVALVDSTRTEAGVSYQDPAGGWRYTYGGTFNAPVVDPGFVGGVGPAGYGKSNDSEALDGTWYHDQSDKWDGSGPGDTGPTPNGPSPGGASALTETGTSYIRVQDAGNPEVHGFVQGQDPINSNRRVYFGHSIADDFGGEGEPAEPPPVNGRNWQRLLDNGITVSFRMRIPNSGPMDPVYTGTAGSPSNQPWFIPPEADYNGNGVVDGADYVVWRDHAGATFQLPNEVANVTPGLVTPEDYTEWRARFGNIGLGRGYPIHDDGRGMVTILQHNGDENDPFYGTDGTVAFSMLTSKDVMNLCAASGTGSICTGSGTGGLVMNNLSGDAPSNSVDSFDTATLNIVPIADNALKNWHEFWITIVDNGATSGTHTVKVYMDGSTTPTIFQATVSGNNNGAYANFNAAFLEFGLSSTDLFGSFDMDFLSYTPGVLTPIAAGAGLGGSNVPEPSACVLVLLAVSGITALRLSRASVS